MAFGDGLKSFGKGFLGFTGKFNPDPVFGRLTGKDKKDRDKAKPEAQYFGGSKDQAEAYRKNYGAGEKTAAVNVAQATGRLGEQYDRARDLGDKNQYNANESRISYMSNMGDYKAGRDATLANAQALEQQSAALPGQYQQTAERQFNLNQARNQNAALSLGATGGAAGLRQALASSSQANADAAGQAEITRANQFNELQQMRQGALVNAANICSGVGGQDQSAAGMESQRNLAFAGNALGANAQAANVATSQGQLGTASQGQYLQAQQGMEGSQLDANKKAEDQRQLWERQQYNKKWHPIMSNFNQM